MVDEAGMAEYSNTGRKRGGRRHGGKEDVGQLAHVTNIKASSLNFFRRRLYFQLKKHFLRPLFRKKDPPLEVWCEGEQTWPLVQLDLGWRVAAKIETLLMAAGA